MKRDHAANLARLVNLTELILCKLTVNRGDCRISDESIAMIAAGLGKLKKLDLSTNELRQVSTTSPTWELSKWLYRFPL